MSIAEKVKKLPLKPGVYIFLDKKGRVLYVGRATSLRRRVAYYGQKNLDPRLTEMISQTKRLKHYQTDTLLDAVILEANLIKKHWPKYNIRERDDRSFIYIVIPKTNFPAPLIVRSHELNKFFANHKPKLIENYKFKIENSRIFGPYQSLTLVKSALKIIRRLFPYSTCTPLSGKPCFDYQIGLCPGACVGAIAPQDYQKNIQNIILLLKGEKKKLLKKLAKENPEKIKSIKHIQDVALVDRSEIENWKLGMKNSAERVEGYDISHLTGKETYGAMAVFTNGQSDKNEYRLFKIKEAPANDDLRALEEMLKRRFRHPEWRLPDLMVIDGGRPQVNFLSKALTERQINIPLVGISKYGGAVPTSGRGESRPAKAGRDKLVFPAKTRKTIKQLIEIKRGLLLKIRNEAHRFAISAGRRRRRKTLRSWQCPQKE